MWSDSHLILIQPFSRQVFFQRCDYNLPLYGKIDESSFFQASQITHVGLLIDDNRDHLNFYDHILGLRRGRDEKPGTSTYSKVSGRAIFSLEEHVNCQVKYICSLKNGIRSFYKKLLQVVRKYLNGLDKFLK